MMKHHEEKHEKCECGHCHEHEHDHEHECEHEHEHCHDHDDDCGCGCGHDHDHDHGEQTDKSKTVLRYVLGAIPVIIGFIGAIPFHIPLIASVIGYVFFGAEVFVGMIRGFAKKKIFTEFTLMCVATIGAFAIGEFADAAAVMYLYSLGETISAGAYTRSKRNISELIEITPEHATVIRGGETLTVEPDDVGIDEIILVRVGERIPLDGVVISGGGNADTSSVTGESKPLELFAGVRCPSGAMLTNGSVQIRVEKEYENSVVMRLRRAVKEASKRKSSAEKKISRFAAVFTPIAFAVALCLFAIGALVTGNVAAWLKAAIMVLVVSCPCSLVLSVPLTYFAGVGSAASSGIIFKGGEVMDRTARLGCVVFDKTGTLTESGMSFDGVKLYGDTDEKQFLALAKAVLTHSPHAAAISFCRDCTVEANIEAESVENIGGRGICCTVNGKRALFGNAKLMEENGIEAQTCDTTCIYGAYDGKLLGRLEFSSRLKDGVRETVKELGKLGVHRIAVVSGDTESSVRAACEDAGIKEYYAACAPDEKLSTLNKMIEDERAENNGEFTAFCGDGLNDSAVIAASDVGIAMGGCGSALTVDSADIVLMDDDPKKICTAIRISRRTARVANANIVLSLGIKIGVLLISVILAYLKVDVPIELAIVADVGAAVIAVLNSLRAAKKERV